MQVRLRFCLEKFKLTPAVSAKVIKKNTESASAFNSEYTIPVLYSPLLCAFPDNKGVCTPTRELGPFNNRRSYDTYIYTFPDIRLPRITRQPAGPISNESCAEET
ncbi:unnamed protein product [Allacma fusca]|uniref:Uncharacterized protein n=1 Tax=Allacma fusca TaxID=39272 RepID=A0A8J2LYG3_9HEXA|nr:unnamed protein product [Allacma fusca]